MVNIPPRTAYVRNARAATSSAANNVGSTRVNGESFYLMVRDPSGQIRSVTPTVQSFWTSDIELTVGSGDPDLTGWKVQVVALYGQGGSTVNAVSKSLYFQNLGLVNGNVLLRIPVSSLRQTASLARLGAATIRKLNRGHVPQPYPLKQRSVRPSPEVHTSPMPTWSFNGSSWSYPGPTNVEIFRRTWSGTVTPHFGKLKRSELPVNPLAVYIRKVQDDGWCDASVSQGYYNEHGGPYTGKTGTGAYGPTPATAVHNAGTDNKAIARLMPKTGSDVTANLAQDLAQLNQTASTIANAVTRISGAIGALRRRNVKAALNSLWADGNFRLHPKYLPQARNSVANNWLCLQYGWKPLLQDVDGSMEALANYFVRDPVIVRQTTASAKIETYERGEMYHKPVQLYPCGHWSKKTFSQTRYRISWTIDSRLVAFLQQTGFLNPINLAWEILPFSFVADWFLPIGPYLESLTAYSGLTLLRGCKTQFTTAESIYFHSYSGNNPSDPSPSAWYQSVGAMVVKDLKLDRTPVTSWPRLGIPHFKNPLSKVHIANGLALIQQVFGGKSR